MNNQRQAILEAFKTLGGERSIREIAAAVQSRNGDHLKACGTVMADMVPLSRGGNPTSTVPNEERRLARVKKGVYRLI